MSFCLCNAPSTFVRLIETVLQGLLWQTCLVYLDDVVVFEVYHCNVVNVRRSFHSSHRSWTQVESRKCKLLATQTEYLGHIISQ